MSTVHFLGSDVDDPLCPFAGVGFLKQQPVLEQGMYTYVYKTIHIDIYIDIFLDGVEGSPKKKPCAWRGPRF